MCIQNVQYFCLDRWESDFCNAEPKATVLIYIFFYCQTLLLHDTRAITYVSSSTACYCTCSVVKKRCGLWSVYSPAETKWFLCFRANLNVDFLNFCSSWGVSAFAVRCGALFELLFYSSQEFSPGAIFWSRLSLISGTNITGVIKRCSCITEVELTTFQFRWLCGCWEELDGLVRKAFCD